MEVRAPYSFHFTFGDIVVHFRVPYSFASPLSRGISSSRFSISPSYNTGVEEDQKAGDVAKDPMLFLIISGSLATLKL